MGSSTRFATAAEPLMLEVRDQTGAPVAGAGVVFSRVAGEASLPGATDSEAVAATDEQGRAMMPLVLREAPDASIVAASLSADQMEQFGLVLAASNEEVVQAVAAALRRSATDVSTVQTYQMRLERAVAHLERHDAVGALRELTEMLDKPRRTQPPAPARATEEIWNDSSGKSC